MPQRNDKDFKDRRGLLQLRGAVFGVLIVLLVFAAALAKSRKAELVTGDPEFKQVEDEIKIGWLK